MKDFRVKANQIELQIREYEAEEDAIIFLHFSGANLMMWQRVIPYFRDHYRLILVDLRGHGKSDRPDSGYYMNEMARDVIGIMHHLNLDRVHIVGSSLGAEVGISLAANYPESILSLTCDGALSSEYGPYGTWEGSENEFEEFVSNQLKKMKNIPETTYPSVDTVVEASRETLDEHGWWNEYVEAMVKYGTREVEEGKYMKSFSRRAMYDYMKHYFYYRLEEYYRRVKCPLLMLPGEDLLENERERAAMEGLRELTKQGEIVRVRGWVHPYGWLIEPEGVCKAILNFLTKAA